jgi:hypothetical protein
MVSNPATGEFSLPPPPLPHWKMAQSNVRHIGPVVPFFGGGGGGLSSYLKGNFIVDFCSCLSLNSWKDIQKIWM